MPDIGAPGDRDDSRLGANGLLSDEESDDGLGLDSIDYSSSLSDASELSHIESVPPGRPARAGKGKGKGATALEAVRKTGKGKGRAPAKGPSKDKKGKTIKSLESARRLSRASDGSGDDVEMQDAEQDQVRSSKRPTTAQKKRKITVKPPKEPAAAKAPHKQPKKVREGAPPSLPSGTATPADVDESVADSPGALAIGDRSDEDGPSDDENNEVTPSEGEDDDDDRTRAESVSTTATTTAASSNPYAIPTSVQDPSASTTTGEAGPSSAGAPGTVNPLDPAKPIKRGRGRPPKNGVAAQRRKKPSTSIEPKIDPILEASGSIPAPGRPEGDNEPIQLQITYPEGEEPPFSAPEGDRMQKPPYTYASLIAQAVQSSATKKLTLHGIYDWITDRWPYFTDNQNGWQVRRPLHSP